MITPAAPKLTLTIPDSANAGYPVNIGVVVKDVFGTAIPDYAGTVTFTSSETGAGAVLPGAITFTGDDIGTTDHVLYTAASRKRVAGTNFSQRTEVQAGQVFYSVRLKLQQTGSVGPVFDGAQPSPLFRASVRDQYGDDFVTQSDFGIGKLEVR